MRAITLPEKPQKIDTDEPESFVGVNIGNLHLHSNELAEIRKIAEKDHELANKIVENSSAANRRSHRSFVIAMILTFALLCLMLIFVGIFIFLIGPIESFVAVSLVLACGVFIRAYLTGEWSETGWIAQIVKIFRPKD